MMVAHFDPLVADDEYDRAPLPEMTHAQLWEFHHRAATIAFRHREFFPGASPTCSRSATPIAKPGTLAGLMQANASA